MNINEAAQNIGKPFQVIGILTTPDKIREVKGGIIIGEFTEAPADDCQLITTVIREKRPVPPGLQRWLDQKREAKGNQAESSTP